MYYFTQIEKINRKNKMIVGKQMCVNICKLGKSVWSFKIATLLFEKKKEMEETAEIRLK